MVEQKVFSLVRNLLAETSIAGLEAPTLQAVQNAFQAEVALLYLRSSVGYDLVAQFGLDALPEIHQRRRITSEEQTALQEGQVLIWNVPEDYRGPNELNYANLGARQAVAFGLRGGSQLVGYATFLFRERASRDAQFQLLNNVGAVWGLQFEQVRSKNSLAATERVYRLIAENTLDLIRLVAPDGRHRYVSPSVKTILGYEVEEFMPFSLKEWIDPRDLERVQKLRKALLEGETDLDTSRYRARHKDGRTIWLETTGRAIRDSDTNELTEFQTTSRDVTEEVLAQQKLEDSEHLYRAITENASDLVRLIGPDGRYRYVSPSVKNILGYEVEEFLKLTMTDWSDPDEIDRLQKIRADLLRAERDPGNVRHKVRRKDGRAIWLETATQLIRDPDTNEVTELQATSRDVTEQVLAQQKLEQSEQLYRVITENASDLIRLVTLDGTTRFVSPSIKSILGYEVEEFKALKLEDWVDPTEFEHIRKLRDEVFRSGLEVNSTLYRARHKDGHYIWIDTIWRSKHDPITNEIVEFQATSRDITLQVLAQQQLEDSERLYRLISEEANDLIQLFSGERELLYVSPSVRTILGYEPEEYLATPPRERIHPEDSAMTQNTYSLALSSDQDAYTFQARIKHKDGTYLWMENSVKLIRDPETREITEIQTSGRDVTERMRIQDEISNSEKVFRKMFTDNPLPMWVFDRESLAFLEVNEAAQQKYGYSHDEFLTMKITDLRLEEDVPALISEIASLSGNMGAPARGRQVLKDGRVIHVELARHAMHYGSRRAFLVVAKDTTDQVNADLELQRLNEHLERRLQRLLSLHEIDRAIASSVDLQLTLGVFLSQLMSQLGVAAAAISLLNPNTLNLEMTAKVGFVRLQNDLKTLRLGEGVAGRAALERRQIEVEDLSDPSQPVQNREVLNEIEGFKVYFAVPLIAKGQVKGVLGVFHRAPLEIDDEWREFLTILAGQAAIAIDNLTLFNDLQRSNIDLRLAYDETIEGWSKALDLRDKETEGHSQRVTEITLRLAERLGIAPEELIHVRRGALLHDIGKMGIPDGILLKPGKLTLEERLVIERHPDLARELLTPIRFLRTALDIPYSHHEKWDGTGYPRGLRGEQIPLSARIFAVVDVWDALRSERPYREGWAEERVIEHLKQDSGKHFDPRVVDAFLEMMNQQHR